MSINKASVAAGSATTSDSGPSHQKSVGPQSDLENLPPCSLVSVGKQSQCLPLREEARHLKSGETEYVVDKNKMEPMNPNASTIEKLHISH